MVVMVMMMVMMMTMMMMMTIMTMTMTMMEMMVLLLLVTHRQPGRVSSLDRLRHDARQTPDDAHAQALHSGEEVVLAAAEPLRPHGLTGLLELGVHGRVPQAVRQGTGDLQAEEMNNIARAIFTSATCLF